MDSIINSFYEFFGTNTINNQNNPLKINLFQVLPDIIENVCMFLPYKYVLAFSTCSTSIHNYINKNDIINKRITFGFPRKSGQCAIHDIIHQNFMDVKSYNSHKTLYDNIIERFQQKPKMLDALYDVLIAENVNLIKGDMLRYDQKIHYIFNGRKIIRAHTLPKDYTVINNNVPVTYWKTYTRLIHLNIKHIRKQLIDNVKNDGLIDPKYTHYTSFIVNDVNYYIIFEDEDHYDVSIGLLSTLDQLILMVKNNNTNLYYSSMHNFINVERTLETITED